MQYRHILTAVAISGMAFGASLPTDVVFGTPQCSQTSNTHISGLTSCGATYEDHTVDRLGNSGGYGWVCLALEEGANSNVADTYFINQCDQIDTDQSFDATLQVKRVDHAELTNWYTDTWVVGAGEDNCGQEHQHHEDFSPCN